MIELDLSFIKDIFSEDKQQKKKLTLKEFLVELNFPYQLEPFQYSMFHDVYNKKGVVQYLGTRDIGKTDILAIINILFSLYSYPDRTYVFSCKEYSRSKNIFRVIRGFMLSAPHLFNIKSHNETQLILHESQSKDPSLLIKSINTSIRGLHPYSIIIDDPLTREDSSPAIRYQAERFYYEALSVTSNILIIGQPTHKNDLYAILRKSDGVEKHELWYDDVPDSFERKKSLDVLKSRGLTDQEIQANYFGNIIDVADFPFSEIQSTNEEIYGDCIVVIDPAFSGEDLIGIALINEFTHQAKVFAINDNFYSDTAWQKILAIIRAHNAYIVYVESNDNGGAFRFAQEKWGDHTSIYPFKSFQNKEERVLSSILSMKDTLKVCFTRDYVEYVRDYCVGETKDDVVDALATACHAVQSGGVFFRKCKDLSKKI